MNTFSYCLALLSNLRDSSLLGVAPSVLSLSRVVSGHSPFAWNLRIAAASCAAYSFGSAFRRSPVPIIHMYELEGLGLSQPSWLLNSISRKKSSTTFLLSIYSIKNTPFFRRFFITFSIALMQICSIFYSFLHFSFYFNYFDQDLSKKLISKFLHFNQCVLYKAGFENDT